MNDIFKWFGLSAAGACMAFFGVQAYEKSDACAGTTGLCYHSSATPSAAFSQGVYDAIQQHMLSVPPSPILAPPLARVLAQLETADFGQEITGYPAAAAYYFGVDPGTMTAAHTVAVLTIYDDPAQYNPYTGPAQFYQKYDEMATALGVSLPAPEPLPRTVAHLFPTATLPLNEPLNETYPDHKIMLADHTTGDLLAATGTDPGAFFVLQEPGRALLPMVYGAGFAHHLTPDTDAQTLFQHYVGKEEMGYTALPDRHGLRARTYSLRDAFAADEPVTPVRIAQFVGEQKLRETFEKLGLSHAFVRPNPLQETPKSAGTASLFQLFRAYATVARGGEYTPLYWNRTGLHGWPHPDETDPLRSTNHGRALPHDATTMLQNMMKKGPKNHGTTGRWGAQSVSFLWSETEVAMVLGRKSEVIAEEILRRNDRLYVELERPRVVTLVDDITHTAPRGPGKRTRLIQHGAKRQTYTMGDASDRIELTAHEPVQWFLNGEFVMESDVYTLRPAPGAHVVRAVSGYEYDTLHIVVKEEDGLLSGQ